MGRSHVFTSSVPIGDRGRMNRSSLISSILLSLACVTSATAADVPSRLLVQGRLVNAGGGLLASTVSLDVALYTAASGGAPVWLETLTGVQLDDGVFSAILGGKTALSPALFGGADLWMGFAVDGGLELPRTPVASVAFAFRAATAAIADSADDLDCDACVSGDEIAAQSVTLDRLLAAGCVPGDAVVYDGDGFDCGPTYEGTDSLKTSTVFGGDVTGTYQALALAPGAVDAPVIAAGAVTPEKLAQAVADALVPAGSIVAFGGSVAPAGWLLCDGTAVNRAQNARLFQAIGTAHGSGDGTTTFNLPDLRGRSVVGAGLGPGLQPKALGAQLGAESVTLSVGHLPPHTHTGTTEAAGSHAHTGSTENAGDHGHTGSVAAAGSHAHTGTSLAAGAHTHTEQAAGTHGHGMDAAGNHTHTYARPLQVSDTDRGSGSSTWSVDNVQTLDTDTAGNHSHTIHSGGSHAHTIDAVGDHTHGLTISAAADHTHGLTVNNAGLHLHAFTTNAAGSHAHGFTTDATGGAVPVPVQPPGAVLTYIIKL